MTPLKTNIDYHRTTEQINAMGNIKLTQNYIESTVNAKHNTLKGQKLRTYGRLQRKLDAVVEIEDAAKIYEEATVPGAEKKCVGFNPIPEESTIIQLEADEVDFLKDVFTEPSFPSSLAKFYIYLMDAIRDLGKEA